MALPVHLPDEESVTVAVDSWTTSEELAGHVIKEKGNVFLYFVSLISV